MKKPKLISVVSLSCSPSLDHFISSANVEDARDANFIVDTKDFKCWTDHDGVIHCDHDAGQRIEKNNAVSVSEAAQSYLALNHATFNLQNAILVLRKESGPCKFWGPRIITMVALSE